jgi:hypothetical protein
VLWAFERRDAGDDCELFDLMRQRGFTSVRDLSTEPAILAALPPPFRREMRGRTDADGSGDADATTSLPMDEAARAVYSDGISLFSLTRGDAEGVPGAGMWSDDTLRSGGDGSGSGGGGSSL